MYAPKHLAPKRKATQASANKSRTRWTIAFAIWLCVVWGHSLMSGDLSSFESSRFVFLLRPIFALFGNSDERLMTLVIRKGAHLSEYTVLLVIGFRMARAWFGASRRAWALVAAIWVVTPCVDETIQRFTPGRAGVFTDVLIDMSGGLLGILIACLYARAQRRCLRRQG